MPRPRKHALFELGGQWIAREHGTGQLYRFWNDAGAGRTRRASLGTPDLERAKLIFAEAVIKGATRSANDHLSLILEAYFEARTDHLPSKDQARFAGALMLECWGELVRANALQPDKQKAFAEWSVERGHSLGYISRNLSVLASAITHAKLNVKVTYHEAEMLAAWPLAPKPRRTAFVPSDAELAAFFSSAMPDNLFRWAVMACLTGGRPEAVNELAPAARIRDAGLIDLNPEGRRQTKKHRPIVRAPAALTGWLDKWEEAGLDATGGAYCGYDSREGLKTALQRARGPSAANLPRLTLYSFRHKTTAVLRAAGGVSEDEIAWQLGHRRPNLRTTAAYGERSPDYLKASAAALDAWWRRLQTLTETALFSRGIPKPVRTRTKRAA